MNWALPMRHLRTVRTDVAVMYACGIAEVQPAAPRALCPPRNVGPGFAAVSTHSRDALCYPGRRGDGPRPSQPAHLLVDTFPTEQAANAYGCDLLYKAQKKSSTSSHRASPEPALKARAEHSSATC